MREQISGGAAARRRTFLAVAAMAGIVILVLVGGRPSEASYPGKPGKILFKRGMRWASRSGP